MAENEATVAGARREQTATRRGFFGGGVSRREVAAFFRELSILIDVGIPLLRALRIMQERCSNPAFTGIIRDLADTIEHGGTLANAMSKYPRVFSQLSVSVVRVGEVGGVMEQSLRRLSDFLETDIRFTSKMLFAMMYPFFALLTMLGAVIIILVFVVPQFRDVFSETNEELPWPTRFMFGLSALLGSWWGVILILAVVAIFVLIYLFSQSAAGKPYRDRVRLRFRLPVIGMLGTKAVVARTTGTFAILLRSGIQVIDALRIVGKTSDNVLIERAYEETADAVERGESTIAKKLDETGYFPPLMIDMVSVGDEAGALDVVMDKVSVNYQEEVEMSLEALNRVIEPVLILLMGAVVLFIAVSVYLPYFKLGSIIQP